MDQDWPTYGADKFHPAYGETPFDDEAYGLEDDSPVGRMFIGLINAWPLRNAHSRTGEDLDQYGDCMADLLDIDRRLEDVKRWYL